MTIRSLHAILLIYAVVIIGTVVYFVFLQHFGLSGLEFSIAGKDNTIGLLDIAILIATIISIILLGVAVAALRRTRDIRIFTISVAFFFFVLREILDFLRNFYPKESIYIDHAAKILELLILLSFMFLMYKAKAVKMDKAKAKKE